MEHADLLAEKPLPHRWRPIEDLPVDVTTLTQVAAEVAAIRRAWSEKKTRMEASGELTKFNERLVRQWCVETGVLEGIYTVNSGLTLTLIERGFDMALVSEGETNIPAGRLIDILRDHERAARGLFAFVARNRPLSTSYIRELHQVLVAHQEYCDGVDQFGNSVRVPLVKGDWKQLPNNPSDAGSGTVVHEYCPPEHVAMEMDHLIAMHSGHDGLEPEVSAAWLHHRFTQIHPFQDGNGRVARALATLVLLQKGGFPLVVLRDDKIKYIGALRAADDGGLSPLVALFSSLQKASLLQAMDLANQSIASEKNINVILDDAGSRLRAAAGARQAKLHATTDRLWAQAETRIREVEKSVRQTLFGIPGVDVALYRSDKTTEYFFAGQIIATARDLKYYANVSGKRAWVQLRIRHSRNTAVVVSFHHVDRADSDVMAASAFVVVREAVEDGAEPLVRSEPCCTAPFTFTADRIADDLTTAFADWLDDALTTGLRLWHRSL